MAVKQLDDSQQDERYNPSGAARDLYKQENNRDAFDDIANNYDQTADDASENKNIAKLKDDENTPTGIPGQQDGGWKTNVSSGNVKKKISLKGRLTKKKGIVGGLIALALGGGGLGVFLMSPSMMLIDLSERFTLKNDTTSTAMERRMMKVFGAMTTDGELCTKGKNIKCRMGKISNSALRKLNKKGITAIFDADGNGKGGTKYSNKRTGYPDKNPTHYEIDVDGEKRTIKAADLKSELLKPENRKIANKVFGRSGAFNMRVQAWTGKYASKFFGKFGLRMNGGLADGQNKKLPAKERLKAAMEKMKSKIPGAESVSSTASKIQQKVREKTGNAKKGGAAYVTAVAGCVTAKAPSFIAAGVAAVQLMRIMPFVAELVLSPGSKAKASGVDKKNSISADDMDTIGTLLTNKTKNADGKMTSALDSPYLLKALGANTARTSPSGKFSPGYSILKNPLIESAREVEKGTKDACNVIMSPTAMWTAAAVDATATVAANATIVGGVIKFVAGWLISELVTHMAGIAAKWGAEKIITELANPEAIDNAQGEELGDAVGISAMAFFSAGGMNRHLPTLSESQVTAYQSVKNENIAFMNELEKSDINPLDITSRNTVPGSILANIRTAALQTGTYGTPLAVPAALASLPKLAFIKPAYAAENNDCNYAKDFGLDTGSPKTTPAINAAGLPCTGITPTQADMSTEKAIELLEDEGWLNTDVEIDEGATIDELFEKTDQTPNGKYGAIKKDTPLAEFALTCSDAQSGDYLLDAAGCISFGEASSGSIGGNYCDNEGKCTNQATDNDADLANLKVKNPRSLQAISVFLLDYQVMQAINGDDEIDGSETQQPPTSEVNENDVETAGEPEGLSKNWASPVPKGVKPNNSYGKAWGGYPHNGEDFSYRSGQIYSVCDGVVVRVDNKGEVRTPGNVKMSNHLTVNCGGGIYARYHHYYYRTVKPGVRVGAKVTAGQALADVGNQGNTKGATGYHLHLEIRTDDSESFKTTKNPVQYLRGKGVTF